MAIAGMVLAIDTASAPASALALATLGTSLAGVSLTHTNFDVAARTVDGEVMGFRDRDAPVIGVQFHPESVLTPDGPRLLSNFLALSVQAPSVSREGAQTGGVA